MFKVAIVGRPNVGKSSLFNLLCNQRKAITDDVAGTTIDRLYADATWVSRTFKVIDTGGLEKDKQAFKDQIKAQVDIAIYEADLIIFLTDVLNGVTTDDIYISSMLKKINKDIVVVVNKVDNENLKLDSYQFYELGFSDVISISTFHKIGIGNLCDYIVSKIKNEKKISNENFIKFSIVGRCNVGKSSLANAILNTNRSVVSDIPGTTLDIVDTSFKRNNKNYTVIDTAGILKRGSLDIDKEKYAQMRALDAIENSDVCLLLLDASMEFNELDKNIAGYIKEAKKGIVIVLNKWDKVIKDDKTMFKLKRKVREEFKMFQYSDIVFVSAKEKLRLNELFDSIDRSYININKEFKTSLLNQILAKAITLNPPKMFNNGLVKFKYATQKSSNPIKILLFVNNPDYLHFSYLRYLENEFQNTLQLTGAPLIFEVVKGE